MAGTGNVQRIERIVQPTVEAMGYRLVRVLLSGRTDPRLQIMVERIDDKPMKVDDCVELSRAISVLLDAEDPLPNAYTLEVSSPGLDRPLTRLDDYTRFAGREASVEIRAPINGRRRFRGRLSGVTNRNVKLQVEGADVVLPFDEIEKARLVVTNDAFAPATRQ